MNNHYAVFCSSNGNEKCVKKHIDQDIALIPHYRATGKRSLKAHIDTLIWKYRKGLEMNANKAISKMNRN